MYAFNTTKKFWTYSVILINSDKYLFFPFKFQLELARTYVDHHMKEFGYKKPNINFVQGYIEALTEAGLENDSFDVIM